MSNVIIYYINIFIYIYYIWYVLFYAPSIESIWPIVLTSASEINYSKALRDLGLGSSNKMHCEEFTVSSNPNEESEFNTFDCIIWLSLSNKFHTKRVCHKMCDVKHVTISRFLILDTIFFFFSQFFFFIF